jgi:hypothetical protein
MHPITRRVIVPIGLAILFVTAAASATIPVGYIAWDVNFPGNAGQFDITNLSGPNAAPPTFPITTTLNLSSLGLVVGFVGGGTTTEPSGYFSLAPDGESLNGTAIPIGGTNPMPTSATLTGLFSPTSIAVSGMGTVSIQPSFSVAFSDTPNLMDGDLAVIYATVATVSSVPEPGTPTLIAVGIAGLIIAGTMKAKKMNTGGKLWSKSGLL